MENEKKVNSQEWSKMSFDDLLQQKNIMVERYHFLAAKGHGLIAKKTLEGIHQLESLILSKI